MEEIPLTGGRTTTSVVRIGETVRRPLSPNSPFIHTLLHYLERAGFDGAPRFLGVDDKSREILSYQPGTVPSELGPYSDDQLITAAQLIRRYHDATIELARKHDTEVICHHDLSPCNFVFINHVPRAIIDFDAAAPGSSISDVSYAAWMWLDIGNPAIEPHEQNRRLSIFCQAYGQPVGAAFLEAMLQRQMLLAEAGQKQNPAMGEWAKQCYDWTKEHLV